MGSVNVITKPFKIIFLSVFAIFPTLCGILALSILCIPLRVVVKLLARLFYAGTLDGILIGVGHMFALGSTPNRGPVNMVFGITIKGSLAAEEERAHIEKQVLKLKDQSGLLVYKHLRQTWTNFLGFAFWKWDKDFAIENHVKNYSCGSEIEVRGKHLSPSSVSEITKEMANKPWEKERSPWEILFVPFSCNGKMWTLVVLRADHVLMDAYSVFQLAKLLMRTECRLPEVQLKEWKPSIIQKLLILGLKVPYDLAETTLKLLETPKIYHQKCSVENGKFNVSSSSCTPSDTIKKIKNHFRVQYSTVIYSAIIGAIKRALEASEQFSPQDLGMMYIVPKPKHPGGLTVHASIMIATVPAKGGSPAERLQSMEKRFKDLRNSTLLYSTGIMTEGIQSLPTKLRQLLLDTTFGIGISVQGSVFPIVSGRDSYKGMEVQEMFTGGSIWHPNRFNAIVSGVSDHLRCQFMYGEGVFASESAAANLGKYFDEELHMLLKSAGNGINCDEK